MVDGRKGISRWPRWPVQAVIVKRVRRSPPITDHLLRPHLNVCHVPRARNLDRNPTSGLTLIPADENPLQRKPSNHPAPASSCPAQSPAGELRAPCWIGFRPLPETAASKPSRINHCAIIWRRSESSSSTARTWGRIGRRDRKLCAIEDVPVRKTLWHPVGRIRPGRESPAVNASWSDRMTRQLCPIEHHGFPVELPVKQS